MDILTVLPEIFGGVVLTVFAVTFIWILIRRYGPVANGKILGPHEIIGRKADGTCERFKSNLVEVNTHNSDNVAGIKRVLAGAIEQRSKALKNELSSIDKDKFASEYERKQDEINDGETYLKTLETEDLSKFFRVVCFRDGFQKHVFLQHTFVEKSLNEYATPEGNKFTFSFGFQTKGVIMGGISDEEETVNLPRIGDFHPGRFKLHYFIPDIRKDSAEKAMEPPKYLARIALYVPASVELNDQIHSLNEQLRDKDRKLKVMANDLSAAATERDGYRITLEGFGVKDPQKLLDKKKKVDLVDLFLIAVPSLVGYFVAQSMNITPFAGVVVGVFGGGALAVVARR